MSNGVDKVGTVTRSQDWAITVPSMLDGAPLIVVAYSERARSGYIELPVPPEVAGDALRQRVRVPIGRDQLHALMRVILGWPL